MAEDLQDLDANNIRPIDLVVVNLYPFEQTIAKPGVTLADAIEQIDIGGPAMLRASAKNHAHLTVLCNPNQYDIYLEELRKNNGEISLEFRQKCAIAAFSHTGNYDQTITAYLSNQTTENKSLPVDFSISGKQLQSLRYGENPHQAAAWYQTGSTPTGWTTSAILQGKELSYNNLVDLEAARQIIVEFPEQPAAVIIKHKSLRCGCWYNFSRSLSKGF